MVEEQTKNSIQLQCSQTRRQSAEFVSRVEDSQWLAKPEVGKLEVSNVLKLNMHHQSEGEKMERSSPVLCFKSVGHQVLTQVSKTDASCLMSCRDTCLGL